jgi:hypothetical protein
VAKGESRLVWIPLAVDDLRRYDSQKDDYAVRPGRYEVQIGPSSEDIRLTASIQVVQ